MPKQARQPMMIGQLNIQLAEAAHDALDYLLLVAHGNDEYEERRDSVIDNLAEMLACAYCKDYEFVDGEVIWIDNENTGVDISTVRGAEKSSPP